MEILLREATIADAPMLRYWDEQPHVLRSDPNDEWNWETELLIRHSWREQLIATVDNYPIGFIQIIDPALEESHYWGDIAPHFRAIDIWIGEEKNLNKGYGTRMMHLAVNRCFSNAEVRAILIDPLKDNKDAHRFYERQGFVFVEERKFNEDECFVYELTRTNWNNILKQRDFLSQ